MDEVAVTPGRQTTLSIRTPEGVVFALPLAGPVTRFFAWLADFLIVATVQLAAILFLNSLSAVVGGLAIFLLFLILLVVPIAYGILLEWWWNGQTVGKRLTRLRVIDETGLGLTVGQIVVRNLLRAVDSLPFLYAVGGACCALSRRCQRLGDIAAGTVVVRSPKESVPSVEGILKGKYNSFREHPHLEARLRQRVSPQEAQVALSAMMRRDEIDPDERLRVYARLADHFKEVVAFPDEVTVGLTDEQYLRNVVESLFRGRGDEGAGRAGGR